MRQTPKAVEIFQGFLSSRSNRPALWVAALASAVGLVVAGGLVANGTISLEKLRQSAAEIGTSDPVEPPSARHDQASDTLTERDAAGDEVVAGAQDNRSGGSIEPPTFDIVRVEPDGNAVLAGLSPPGDRIEVLSDGRILARARANSAGEWALVLDQPLPAGGHQISVRSISEERETEIVSVQNVTVAVPETRNESAIVMLDQPGQPSTIWQSPAKTIRPDVPEESSDPDELDLIDRIIPSQPSGTEVETVPEPERVSAEAENATDETSETERAHDDAGETLVTIEAVETEGESDLLVSGASLPRASIRLFLDNKLLGETVAGPVGRWHFHASDIETEGRLKLRAEQLKYAGGPVIARREVPFERDPQIVGSLAANFDPGKVISHELRVDEASGRDNARISGKMIRPQRVVVGRGDNLWSIARRIYGSGVRYTTLYSANEAQIRNPANVYPDQVLETPELPPLAN
jgi:nucleoid-associated protein YgaU